MTETSQAAYYAIRDKLPERRRAVLLQLEFYIASKHEYPTARELYAWCGIDGCWKRLPELRRAGMVDNPDTRVCRITGSRSMTWEPVRAEAPKDDQQSLFSA